MRSGSMLKFLGLTGALRADAGVVSVGMVRTADVTPVNVVGGVGSSAAHSFGVVPSMVIMEYVCITAEQGYVAGEVVQITAQWQGATQAVLLTWKNTTTVGVQPAAAYIVVLTHKTTGLFVTPTAANWAYRFVIIK